MSTTINLPARVASATHKTQLMHRKQLASKTETARIFSMSKKAHCLLCEKSERSRGLCEMHYNQFARAKKRLPLEDQEEFERIAIERGRIKPLAEPSAFDDIVAEITKRKENASDDETKKAVQAELASKRAKAKAARKNN